MKSQNEGGHNAAASLGVMDSQNVKWKNNRFFDSNKVKGIKTGLIVNIMAFTCYNGESSFIAKQLIFSNCP
ncbi:hypothetical protein [Chryseobacterium sp.]|uniref:hypothetical protein n=1 Tax=Chryseobacterium sp. TaxID=1871047 RepID=UPI0035C661BE